MAKKQRNINKENSKYYEIVLNENSIWNFPKKLITLRNDSYICPKCSEKLKNDYTLIPVSKSRNAKVYGKRCQRCRCLYISNPNEIIRFLKDKPIAKEFTLDGKELWRETELKKEKKEIERQRKERGEYLQKCRIRLSEVESACMIVLVEFEDKTICEFIIVNNKANEDTRNNIYHYTSEECREILSAAFETKKNHKGSFNGKNFKVVNTVTCQGYCDSAPDSIAPTYLYIKKDGGFSSSVKNKNFELVDMLLYSPFTKKYEIIRATYDKTEFDYYTDAGNYRRFVKKYGNPQIDLLFSSSNRGFGDFGDLNTESALHEFGYNVNKSDGLSSAERHSILSELVDLEILKVEKIVAYLDLFINTHSSSRYFDARCKWEFDKNYIMNYKANPSRFLIAKNEL